MIMTKEIIEMLFKGMIAYVIYTLVMCWALTRAPHITKIKEKDRNKLRRTDCEETF